VKISLTTSAGHAGRPNEDFVGAVPGAVVLLDGAGIPGSESLCSHGVAWCTHRLGGALLGRLSRDDALDLAAILAAILAAAIGEIAAEHRDTCDIANPSSPQTTVAIVRVGGGRLEYLVLADSYLVLDRGSAGPQVLTDPREVESRRICSAPLSSVPTGTPDYDRILASCSAEMRARRNRPGGYWIAKDDPQAASEAMTGTLSDVHGFALLSNGASRIVDPYALTDWPGMLALPGAGGPREVIRRVRDAEAGFAAAVPDDATVAHCIDLQA
jgi:protein phosphatase 2C-like protein